MGIVVDSPPDVLALIYLGALLPHFDLPLVQRFAFHVVRVLSGQRVGFTFGEVDHSLAVPRRGRLPF